MQIQILVAKIFVIAIAALASDECSAQSSTPNSAQVTDLHKSIAAMDSVFFDAFNTCNTQKSLSMFTKDLEFYHDIGGKTNLSQNSNSIIARCNGKTKVRRELVKGSLEVFPLKDFGAIQIGVHRFYFTEPGKEEKLDGTFKFVHIWQLKDGNWKISRVVSYDH